MIYRRIKIFPVHHKRNIMIAFEYLKFGSRKVSEKYGMVPFRVTSIYRILMAHLCQQRFEVPWRLAIHEKYLYKRDDSLQMISDYYLSVFGENIEDVIGK